MAEERRRRTCLYKKPPYGPIFRNLTAWSEINSALKDKLDRLRKQSGTDGILEWPNSNIYDTFAMHELLLSTGIQQIILSSISGSKGHVSDLRQFHVLHALTTGRFDADSQTRLPPMTIAEALSNKGLNLGIFWCLEGHQRAKLGRTY